MRLLCLRERTWRTIAASAALQLYAAAFLAGSDLHPARVQVSKAVVNQGLIVLTAWAFVLIVGDVTDRWFEFGVALGIMLLLYAVSESQDGQPAILSAMTLLGLPLLAVLLKRTILAGRLVTNVLALASVNCAVTSVWSLAWWVVGQRR